MGGVSHSQWALTSTQVNCPRKQARLQPSYASDPVSHARLRRIPIRGVMEPHGPGSSSRPKEYRGSRPAFSGAPDYNQPLGPPGASHFGRETASVGGHVLVVTGSTELPCTCSS